MTEVDVLKTFEYVGALVRDTHLVYTSGRHGSDYVNKDAIYPHTEITSVLCQEIARRFQRDQVEVCLAPAVGGVILSQWTAFHLTQLTGEEVLGIYAEKQEDRFVIRRGYDELLRGKRTLVLEDILTTGGSVRRTVEAARLVGADIIGVAALCNRGGVNAAAMGDVPKVETLFSLSLESWDPVSCPLCRQGIPINTKLGKGLAKSDRSSPN